VAELADVFEQFGPAYLNKYGEHMMPSHIRAIRDIRQCRTRALGGEVMLCPDCRAKAYKYHSCKNRSCPKCQNSQTDTWIQKQEASLLPCLYFMATFTLPDPLRTLTRSHQKLLYGILFTASQQALQQLAKDPKYVGGQIGMLGVLQTWKRDLGYHPHIHYLIPGGGLAPDGKTWLNTKSHDFLMHEIPLAILFRNKYRDLLRKTDLFTGIPSKVWKQNWCVDIEPVGNGQGVLKYLAPYIFRVAISNKNILSVTDKTVTYRFRDRKTDQWIPRTLPGEQFMSLFLQHVLPKGFQKVRTFGLWHPKQRHKLELVKEQLEPEKVTVVEVPMEPAKNPQADFNCPHCSCKMTVIGKLSKPRGPPTW
jgi:Putative transposase/Transposase zinc-binding domain